MDHIFNLANLSCDEVATKLFDIQTAADAAATPYEEAIRRTNCEFIFPYYLHENDHFCGLLVAESTEMLIFIWELIQLGEGFMQPGCRGSMCDFTNIGKSLLFSEIYFKEAEQKQAHKEKHFLLQQIIETPCLNVCLLAGITVAKANELFDEDLVNSMTRVGLL